MIERNERVCLCGHKYKNHFEPVINGLLAHSFSCSCEKFRLDNLRYLKDKHEQKKGSL